MLEGQVGKKMQAVSYVAECMGDPAVVHNTSFT